MNKVAAIILARGGSKGIPKKNIIPIAGHPLLYWTVASLKHCSKISEIFVSTDDKEIKDLALSYGLKVIDRPNDISGDTASSESALLHALDTFKSLRISFDTIIFPQLTSPLRAPNDFTDALQLFETQKLDSLFSARHIEGFVWQENISGEKETKAQNYDPQKRPRRQELKQRLIEENGSFYIFKPEILIKYQSRLGGKIGSYLMDSLLSFQLDSPEDIKLIEQIIHLKELHP